MASKGNRRIEDFFGSQRTQHGDCMAAKAAQPAEDEVPCDPPTSHSDLDFDLPGASASNPSMRLPSYPDVAELTCDDLQKDNEVRRKLLEGEWRHAHEFKFPSKCMRGKQRKFNHTWLNNKGLRYSISQDTVYCIPCVLFGSERSGNSQGGMFGSPKGVSDWGNFGRSFKLHILRQRFILIANVTK